MQEEIFHRDLTTFILPASVNYIMKILLIDDDEAITTVFGAALKKAGFEIIVVPDGKTGLDKAKIEKPNLILLDQILPDMKGNDLLKTLKDDPSTKSIPVSLLSNFGQNELIQQAISIGAVDYILKYQVEPQDLVGKVNEMVKENAGPVSETPVGNQTTN